MQVIINTDHNIPLAEKSILEMESLVESTLEYFASRLTRVEVHLTDGSAGRNTGDDIRCRIEARPEGLNPEFVTDNASSADAAVSGALSKMKHVLETTFGRRDDKHRGGKYVRSQVIVSSTQTPMSRLPETLRGHDRLK